MADSMLEPEYQAPYQAWKQTPTPDTTAHLLTQVQPIVDKAIRTHVGDVNPLIKSRARRLTMDALQGYDPQRAGLRTHLFQQLQGLKRIHRQQGQGIHVSERMSLDRNLLEQHTQELSHVLGREPTDAELSDHTGFSLQRLAKVRQYHPAVAEGTLEASSGMIAGGQGLPGAGRGVSSWHELIYHDLHPLDQKIMELSLGMHGRRPLSNMEIAKRVGRTPGAVSQRKAKIQALLDQEQALSPFGS